MSKQDDDANREAYEMILDDQEWIVDMKHRYEAVLDALKFDEDVEYYVLITENIVGNLRVVNSNINKLIDAYNCSKKRKEEKRDDRIN